MVWKEPNLGPNPTPPLRSKGEKGIRGRSISLISNHFPVTIKNPKIVIYHYDVLIKDYAGSEDIPKTVKQIVFEQLKLSFPKVFANILIAFDGQKNAYSTSNVPQFKKGATYDAEIQKESGRKSKYSVKIVKVNEAKLSDVFSVMKDHSLRFNTDTATIYQMMEVMFRHFRSQKYIQIGRNSFYPHGDGDDFHPRTDIGGGKDGVTGFFASLRPAQWKDGTILLNFDMSHTAFYREQKVTDFMKDTLRLRDQDFNQPLDVRNATALKKDLKGVKVMTMHMKQKRVYKVNGVTPLGANRLKFELTDSKGKVKQSTVSDYFLQQYNCRLKYPSLNCLHVGNPDKKIYIPIEVCHIEKGQRVKKKLSDFEVSQFIRSTAVPPADRLRAIKAAAATNDFKSDKMLNALSFSVEDMPLKIDGRVIAPPDLAMNHQFKPRDGVWDVRGKKFQQPATLLKWAVLLYDDRTRMDSAKKFVEMLVKLGRELGMKIENPFDIFESKRPNPDEDLKYYKDSHPDLQLVMCIISGRRIYSTIKKAGDRDNELITQCVMGMNVQKCQVQTIQNILLKINGKMGGTHTGLGAGNPSMELVNLKEAFMVMGADVNHPPAGSTTTPSIVAVVGSYDKHAAKYAAEVRAQMHRMEIIEDMTEITKNLLKNFHRKTGGRKPSRIIMYRDGVSESQFSEVLGAEMRKMRQACTDLQKDYTPGITFMCVQKRHHTRLFCANERDGVGRHKNVPPGTVVDTAITHPTEKDFYLCSHQGIQGTSRPAHYHVLWDDNNFTMDQLQGITYELCHTYSRCTRAVSIPCPAYYAHLAAFRAKVYVSEIMSDDGMSSTGSTDEVDINAVRQITRVALDTKLGSELYYI